MVYVFDSSFVGALIIPDERNPYVDRMYAKIKNEEEKHAPHLLWYEMANIFKNLLRRKRFTFDEVLSFFPRLTAFRITCDFETGPAYTEKLLRLCNDYNISSYDGSYLELAGRKKAVLCTLDENLRAAAKKHGVAVHNG
ncbi:MAG: type II toxin-antitoxin system VapC family toxin [Treponema sp.]|jgi:predicted nucleic acid-binding protein|nr:type II toxin-antitoxin system VapC family toxin [Treponema sp.]